MNRQDFLKLSGVAAERAEYLPVAFMIRGGYGCAGYYNAELNDDLSDTCVLLNMRLVEFSGSSGEKSRASIHDFSDFLEWIVARHYREAHQDAENGTPDDVLPDEPAGDIGKTIPLAAIDYADIVLLYPVAQITTLMQRAEDSFIDPIPSFLDFRKKSIVFKLLTARLW